MTNRTCPRCSETKPIDGFGMNAAGRDGRGTYCKECKAFKNLEQRLIGRGLLMRVPKNPTEKRCSVCREQKAIDSFYSRTDRPGAKQASCKTCQKKSSAEKYAENPSKAQAAAARWQAANAERAREVRLSYARNNRPAIYARKLARRAVERGAMQGSPVTAAMIAAKMQFHGNRCWMCKGPFEHVDHVKPIKLGGPHLLANLRPACASCNGRKAAKWFGPNRLDAFTK